MEELRVTLSLRKGVAACVMLVWSVGHVSPVVCQQRDLVSTDETIASADHVVTPVQTFSEVTHIAFGSGIATSQAWRFESWRKLNDVVGFRSLQTQPTSSSHGGKKVAGGALVVAGLGLVVAGFRYEAPDVNTPNAVVPNYFKAHAGDVLLGAGLALTALGVVLLRR